MSGGTPDWAQVDAGYGHACAVKTTGRLYCWGSDDAGQLGDDAALVDQFVPAAVDGATNWESVSAGREHTCAPAP